MLRIACLPGDGIGPEVTAVAIEVLRSLPLEFEIEEHAFGGGAILAEGTPLPDQTLAACKAADAVVLTPGNGDDAMAGHVKRCHELGIEVVVRVRDDDELARSLDHVDPEIFLLTA